MRLLFILWFGLYVVRAQDEDIRTYHMHELCGETLNLRRESVFTAKIELLPSAISSNQVVPNNGLDLYNMAHCTLSIESWSFQNRLMVHFEEVILDEKQDCHKPSLEIFDGPTKYSPRVQTYPSTCEPDETLMSRSFVTTDIHMTLHFHGNITLHKNTVFKAVIVSFNKGTCRSYEHQCFNGRCIMQDIVCNGHNPCGDNSDCPTTVSVPHEVEKKDAFMLAVVVVASVTSMLLLVTVIVLCRCYQVRRKHRRLLRHIEYDVVESDPVRNERPAVRTQPVYERSPSQLEADKRFAPPSYSQLPVLEDSPEIEIEEEECDSSEPLPNEISFETCLESDENNPPSYARVMLCQDAFSVSDTNIHELTTNSEEHVVIETDKNITETPNTET